MTHDSGFAPETKSQVFLPTTVKSAPSSKTVAKSKEYAPIVILTEEIKRGIRVEIRRIGLEFAESASAVKSSADATRVSFRSGMSGGDQYE